MRTRFNGPRRTAARSKRSAAGTPSFRSVARLRRYGLLRLIFRWPHTDWRVRLGVTLCAAYAAVVALPAGVAWAVHRGGFPSPRAATRSVDAQETLRVYRMQTGSVVTVALRDYILNVLAAQMPPDAPLAALEADAVAIRTYAVRARTMQGGSAFARDHGADVTDDSGLDLPWLTAAQRDVRYGDDAPVNEARLTEAAQATDGQILTYEGQPILAFTCQMSPGRTRDASKVFGRALPYLPSVPCPDDGAAADLVRVTRLTAEDLQAGLGLSGNVDPRQFRTTGVDTWGFVQSVTYPGHRWSGDVFAGKLGLPTAAFTLSADAAGLTVRTVGVGNGLGMSLHEATAMAASGKSWQTIVSTFYPGTRAVSAVAFYSNN